MSDTGDLARARRNLRIYQRISSLRDAAILDAFDAGLSKAEIHRLSGVSRPHIDKVLGRELVSVDTRRSAAS